MPKISAERMSGDVGIWHETYRVRPGEYEAIYSGMPAHGLGKVGSLAPAGGRRESARGRMLASAPTHESNFLAPVVHPC